MFSKKLRTVLRDKKKITILFDKDVFIRTAALDEGLQVSCHRLLIYWLPELPKLIDNL